MFKDREAAINAACAIFALAYHSIGDYKSANDGFCSLCPGAAPGWDYRNEGKIHRYVLEAVVQRLSVDGVVVDQVATKHALSLIDGVEYESLIPVKEKTEEEDGR